MNNNRRNMKLMSLATRLVQALDGQISGSLAIQEGYNIKLGRKLNDIDIIYPKQLSQGDLNNILTSKEYYGYKLESSPEGWAYKDEDGLHFFYTAKKRKEKIKIDLMPSSNMSTLPFFHPLDDIIRHKVDYALKDNKSSKKHRKDLVRIFKQIRNAFIPKSLSIPLESGKILIIDRNIDINFIKKHLEK